MISENKTPNIAGFAVSEEIQYLLYNLVVGDPLKGLAIVFLGLDLIPWNSTTQIKKSPPVAIRAITLPPSGTKP